MNVDPTKSSASASSDASTPPTAKESAAMQALAKSINQDLFNIGSARRERYEAKHLSDPKKLKEMEASVSSAKKRLKPGQTFNFCAFKTTDNSSVSVDFGKNSVLTETETDITLKSPVDGKLVATDRSQNYSFSVKKANVSREALVQEAAAERVIIFEKVVDSKNRRSVVPGAELVKQTVKLDGKSLKKKKTPPPVPPKTKKKTPPPVPRKTYLEDTPPPIPPITYRLDSKKTDSEVVARVKNMLHEGVKRDTRRTREKFNLDEREKKWLPKKDNQFSFHTEYFKDSNAPIQDQTMSAEELRRRILG